MRDINQIIFGSVHKNSWQWTVLSCLYWIDCLDIKAHELGNRVSSFIKDELAYGSRQHFVSFDNILHYLL